jgi:outer membrane protein assembly factor BamB
MTHMTRGRRTCGPIGSLTLGGLMPLAGLLALAGLSSACGGCSLGEQTKVTLPATAPAGAAVAKTEVAHAAGAQAPAAGPAPVPAVAAGRDEAKPGEAAKPVEAATPAEAGKPGGASGVAAGAVALAAPATTPASGAKELPKAESKDAPKTVAADAVAKGFDPATAPQTARQRGWYQWRGPEQNGVSREKNLPETWNPDTGENVLWTADVGSMSSPVLWNGKLYSWVRNNEVAFGEGDTRTLAPGPKTQEALIAVDVTTGKEAWRYTQNMTQTEVPFHRLGWSSPCVDPSTGRVYALGSQAWLLCTDGDTGKVVWQRQMTEEFGMISTFGGRTPAPTVDEDQMFIAGVSFGFGDNARGQHRVFAFNKHTGELNWTAATGGIPVDAPQNTPVITVVNGVRLVIFAAGDGGIHAFQARTGKKAWTAKVSKRGLNTSVVLDGDKLYCTHGLDNLDTTALGRIFCLDIAHLENGSPKELWKVTGIEAAFPTPVVGEKQMYVVDDRAKLWAFDKTSGKQLWKKNLGQVGKSSPVLADGKIYVADGDGKFWILKPGDRDAKVLSKVDLSEKLGREYVIYGSPAIADGRIYLQAASKLYCIGKKDAKPEYGEIPPMPTEKEAEAGKVAQVQVVPADVALRPGEAKKFAVRTFDANGRSLGEATPEQVTWATGMLTIPPPPPRPAMPKPDSASPASGSPAAAADAPKAESHDPAAKSGTPKPGEDAGRSALVATTQPAAIAAAPATGPTKAGNLAGKVAPDGTFAAEKVAAGNPHQAGQVEATVAGVTGAARVRVFPPLPWKFDFQSAPVGKPPLTWLGAGGKFAVVEDPDDKQNKVLQKLFDIDLYYRARTNFGAVDMTGYTVQSDVKVNEKVIAERHYLPDGGIIDQRYVLILNGMQQTLQIHVWPSALPDPRNPSGSKHATIPFGFEAKKWYRLKLEVTQEKDKAVARGKCWPVGGEEPKDWQLTLDDDIPNRSGNPGLFAVSLVGEQKSEVYYDNILVTDNKAAAAAPTAAAK